MDEKQDALKFLQPKPLQRNEKTSYIWECFMSCGNKNQVSSKIL